MLNCFKFPWTKLIKIVNILDIRIINLLLYSASVKGIGRVHVHIKVKVVKKEIVMGISLQF